MSFQRIWALVLRYLYATRDPSRIAEFVFWPMIDIGYYGLIALWSGTLAHDPNIVRVFVVALVLWQVIYRSNYEVCVNLVDEFLDHNLANLVASPLKKREWVAAMMISGLVKIIFTLLFGAAIGYFFFQVNVFSMGFVLLPFVALCLISGWIIGFLGAAIVIYKGAKLQFLPWVVIMIAALFSSIFYPVSVLPTALRLFASALPMTYIFEGMRTLLTHGTIPPYYWIASVLLSLVYLGLAIKFFLFMFEKSRERGLSRHP